MNELAPPELRSKSQATATVQQRTMYTKPEANVPLYSPLGEFLSAICKSSCFTMYIIRTIEIILTQSKLRALKDAPICRSDHPENSVL